ncbi:MAG: hypothetical protein ACRDKE_01355 [Solirubrobacterales bacterium]
MTFRAFSTSQGLEPHHRTVDSDAPSGFRNELIDLVFSLARDAQLPEEYFPRLMAQNIGVSIAGKPYAGYRHALGRDLGAAHWIRVLDLLPRLANEFQRLGLLEAFRTPLNRILAGNQIAWDLDETGNLVRVLPEEAAIAVRTAVRELLRPGFESARGLLRDAIEAYNDRPQRPRDACANAFDAVEAASKTTLGLPTGTFNDVVRELRQARVLQPEIVAVLDRLNVVRHNHFGHGMTTPFNLISREVDFVYLSCVSAIVLFARI